VLAGAWVACEPPIGRTPEQKRRLSLRKAAAATGVDVNTVRRVQAAIAAIDAQDTEPTA